MWCCLEIGCWPAGAFPFLFVYLLVTFSLAVLFSRFSLHFVDIVAVSFS